MNWSYLSNLSEQELLSVRDLGRQTGLGYLAAQVMWNRGLRTAHDVQDFVSPKLEDLTQPFKIYQLEKSAHKILEVGLSGQPLRVFTDYDVDGTTGAALLSWFFRDLKWNFSVQQPDRFKDGYGLNVSAVEKAVQDGVKLLITVDCGVTNFEAITRARELGLDVIIVDHHQIDPEHGVPSGAYAVIDPQQKEDESGLKQLCGCALAFYLALGIRKLAREKDYFKSAGISEPNIREHLDLVVLATAADMVPLTGDNRILVKHGLEVLKNTRKPGFKALVQVSGLDLTKLSPSSLGFALGPRINASGRMGSAHTAYQCLISTDAFEAQNLAQELEKLNQSRAEMQNGIWDEIRQQVEAQIHEPHFSHAIVIAQENWHEGVVGIVAARVVEHFKRPAIVMSVREDGTLKGSVRSLRNIDVLSALHECKFLLKSYGGHKMAAGVSLALENYPAFQKLFNESIKNIIENPEISTPELQVRIESEVQAQEFTLQNLEMLEKLGPFGPGNPEPVFSSLAKIESFQILKGRHLKLKFMTESKMPLDGIWFNAAEQRDYLTWVEKISQYQLTAHFAGIPEVNRFRGRAASSIRLRSLQSPEGQ